MNKLTSKETVLLVLLLLLTIVIRIPNTTHPIGSDTFSNYARAGSISDYGYATWILHPTSLIGMYPLSYPSSEHFFMSFYSLISGLSIEYSILITQIFISILGVFVMFVFAREFFNFLIAFISAFVFSISTYLIDFTRWFFTTRILLIVLLPLFLWILLKIVTEKNHRIKYIVLAMLMLLFLAMTHRLVQLVAIVLIAYFLTALIFYFPKFKKTKFYNIYFEKRYKISKSNIISDIIGALFLFGIYHYIKYKPLVLIIYTLFFIVIIFPEYKKYSSSSPIKVKSNFEILFMTIIFGVVIFLAKQMDLLFRQRIIIHISRLLDGYYNDKLLGLIDKSKTMAIFAMILLIVSAFLYFLRKKKSNIIEKFSLLCRRAYAYILKKPQFYFSIFVLIVFAGLFASQFFGYSFYAPSEEEYTGGLLFKGSSPLIIFLNMTINYFTGTTLLLPFVVLGLLFLLFKKEKKSFAEVFLIIILLGFTPMLMDKRYTRAFVIPFFSLFIGIGFFAFLNFINKFKYKKLIGLTVTVLLIVSIIFSNVFTNREYFIERERPQHNEKYFHAENAALFLKDIGTDGAIIVNNVITQARISALSKKSDINFLESLIAKKTGKDNIVPFTFSKIFNDLLQGRKVISFGRINDWIFGGAYYSGGHEYTINRFGYNNPKSKLVMEDYEVRYSIWSKIRSSREKNFHKSVSEIKNKIYDNPGVEIIDVQKGR